MRKFMLGCNYWDSANGTDMWKKFDPDVIRLDMQTMKQWGVQVLRVFPNWRDFQPVYRSYCRQGNFREYVFGLEERPLQPQEDGIDPKQIENFRTFANIAAENGITLVVGIVTGWMSGRLFTPPALEGRNLISDPECLMWTQKFVRGFVRATKDLPNIAIWDLGNECNCLGPAATRAEAYHWASTVRDAILAEDKSRPISSGMHSMDSDPESGVWLLQDHGELCDQMSTHPYPSPTVGADVEPYNRLRPTMIPSAQSAYYTGISGKPTMIQETGTFSQVCGNRKMDTDWLRVNTLSALANNIEGVLWWCSFEHTHLNNSPYRHILMERELGLVYGDKSPKPVAYEMQKLRRRLDDMPCDPLPPKDIHGVCVLTKDCRDQQTACSSYILAKQAGLDLAIAGCNYDLPEAPLYIVPAMTGWQVSYRQTWDFLMHQVKEKGATMLLTYHSGHCTEFSETFGIESDGVLRAVKPRIAHFPFGQLPYCGTTPNAKELLIHSIGAEILAINDAGNPILTKNKLGKGQVYFLGFPVEQVTWDGTDVYGDPDLPYYKIYQMVAQEQLAGRRIRSGNPLIGVTEHPVDETTAYAMVINYSDKPQDPALILQNGWQIVASQEPLDEIPHCDGTLVTLKKLG